MSLGTFNKAGPFETRLFINGEFVPSVSGKTFDTVDPATESVICQLQEADAADVDKAVKAATEAFKTWKDAAPTHRRDLMLKLADLISANIDYLAQLESLDNGKPFATSGYGSKADLGLVISCLRYYAGWSEKIQGKTIPVDGQFLVYTKHEPVGVVGQIIPWNFPLLMMAWKLGPALCTGNCIVMKTSEKTPLSALAICKLVQEAGFPPGVLNVVSGFGPTAGEAIARHPHIEKVAFTGSTMTGARIAKAAAESNLKRVSLELGGKSPLIVFPDADLEQAATAAHIGLFLNQGQCCCASSRLFVHEAIYDKFVAECVKQAADRKLGDAWDPTVVQGPQVDKMQFDKVMEYIAKGKAEGAKVATGGERHGDKGYYIQPTVFTDVTDDMTIAKEEIFGPVMAILKFKDTKEAIERANNTQYGLAAGVCTRDIGLALRMASELRAGTVWVNCYDVFHHNVPFGGYKQSGHGRENGEYALEMYTEVKSVWIPIDK
eukprot:TRINITY_DN56822_c0_g1_i1.p1 TRINITY_DN56822_c0_g1~~TRINITY_DN56822_c0_g1_i1.p1  ORF type:complete len:492 (-),score=143.88 TRINITY_DN56822_c0_g1_i1:271-1746(-)